MRIKKISPIWLGIVIFGALILAFVTVNEQFVYITITGGKDYIQTVDFERHMKRIEGTAAKPFQYRLLTDSIIHGLLQIENQAELPEKYQEMLFRFRFVQNFFIFTLMFFYAKRQLGSNWLSLMAMILLSYAMGFAFFMADVSAYTYSEIIFYLLVGILGLSTNSWWIVLISMLGISNRESSILLPWLYFLLRFDPKAWKVSVKSKATQQSLTALFFAGITQYLRQN